MNDGLAAPATRPLASFVPWGFVAAYVFLIWDLSSRTFEFAPIELVPMRDKGVHFVEYGALACLFAWALARTFARTHGLRLALATLWLTAVCGLLDELHQAFVFGRSGDVHDLLADALGALLAVLVCFGLAPWLRRKLSRP